MTQDTPDKPASELSHEEIDEAIVEAIGELQDDPSVDLDSRQKQDAGWHTIYNECPDCESPMARTTVEGSVDAAGSLDVLRVETRGVCPDCGEKKTVVHTTRYTGDIDAEYPPIEGDPERLASDLVRRLEALCGPSVELYELLDSDSDRSGFHDSPEELSEEVWEEIDDLVELAKELRVVVEIPDRE